MADLDEIVDLDRPRLDSRQPRTIVGRQRRRRPRDRVAGEVVEAVDVLDARADLVMVASNDRGSRQPANAIDDGVRVGAVADEIAEYEDGIDLSRSRERRLEGLEVRVDVTYDQITHQNSTHASTRSTISGTGPVASMRTWACAYAS